VSNEWLDVALIREVFFDAERSLEDCLLRARDQGAALAVLPEIPLLPWSPATKESREIDTEPPFGPRHERQADAARKAGIALVGGTIVSDPESGERFNTALVLDSAGELLQSYRKIHLPEEAGFWETSHYASADTGATPVTVQGWSIGVQICSDIMRPMGSHSLAAQGAELIVNPRATSRSTAPEWLLVCRSTALTTSCYVVSTTRPRAEQGVNLGGPSLAAAPDGRTLLESEDEISVVRLERPKIQRAKTDYPGYLPVRGDVYEASWHAAR